MLELDPEAASRKDGVFKGSIPTAAAGLLHQQETARHLLGSFLLSGRAGEAGATLLALGEPGQAEDVEMILFCSLNSKRCHSESASFSAEYQI